MIKHARKVAKTERQKKYQWVFRNGKQVKIKRPPTIEGISVDEFIRNNADPIWLHQNEMWEYIEIEEKSVSKNVEESHRHCKKSDDEIPF